MNLLLRNDFQPEYINDEDEIEKFVTSFILKHGHGFGRFRGWGLGCSNWLFAKAPTKLFVISNLVYTSNGLQHIQKLKAIACSSKNINKEDKSGWFAFNVLSPATDGWYIVLVEKKEIIDEYSYNETHYITCDKYSDSKFSLNVVAWRELPKLDMMYESNLIIRNRGGKSNDT